MSRESINKAAGEAHELTRSLLGLDWYDTESQARSVILGLLARRDEFLRNAFVTTEDAIDRFFSEMKK